MELLTYKTNIRSEAALRRVEPWLNSVVGSANWQLDLNNSDKKLTVFSPGVINESQLIKAVRRAGFKVENLDDYYSVY